MSKVLLINGSPHENGCMRTTLDEMIKVFEVNGLVVGSPVYCSSPNGTLISFLDRLFFSTPFSKHMKVGAAVVNCRRGGNYGFQK